MSMILQGDRNGEAPPPFDDIPFYDHSQGGFLPFLPPPPRPLFLEDVLPSGTDACDLCPWTIRGKIITKAEGREFPGELGWVVTLIIVSFTSALIGAVVMIAIMHCKKSKTSPINEAECGGAISLDQQETVTSHNKNAPAQTPPISSGLWAWLNVRRVMATSPSNLDNLPSAQVMENHYTQYNSVQEAVYDELDREKSDEENESAQNYENSPYVIQSAPSSAYYSDLSCAAMPESTYELVDSSHKWECLKVIPDYV
ncbi:hypothetical protein ABEB36_000559 [Hypothenemus hampei]|uniref:Uncharacterized protein n=1 Tax=Hypothenemus hampei TaxID=57062 RepID=A0ABD1FF98_HYPHA